METTKLILTFMFGAFMIFGGVNHFLKPGMYAPFLPEFLPREAINIVVGISEIVVGIAAFIPQYRSWGALGILVMMLVFLPLHIIDVFRENPAIGSHKAALIRVPFQFLFILWAWFIYRK
jgi:uncharacterized membrane protein